jgi:exonuclease III
MNQTASRKWNIMCWNVRGINARTKWNAIRDKVVDSSCDVVCFQETKKEVFDINFHKNVCPPSFDKFEFLPSLGASGGMLIAWKSSLFRGQLIFSNSFALSVEFSSLHNDDL